MSIIFARNRAVKRALVPVEPNRSRVLFDATRRIKAPYVFGLGVLRTLPSERRDHTALDEAWAADALNNRSDFPSDEVLDAMADEAAFLDRYTKGYCL
jgi:hypothetical protein